MKRKIWYPRGIAGGGNAPQNFAIRQEDADSQRRLVSDATVAKDEITDQL